MAHSSSCTCSYCSYLVHTAHDRRELYEFNIDMPCPCRNCIEDRQQSRVAITCAVFVFAAFLLLHFCVQ